MRCPNDGSKMEKLGISFVCPRCDKKIRQPDKYWIPELRLHTEFPREYDWANFTTTGITVSGGTASLSTGETEGTLISPQFTNLIRSDTQKRDFTKIKIDEITANKQDGRIYFYAANDGGTQWVTFYDDGHTKDLHYGNEGATGTKQSIYNDLRVRIILKRPTSGDTSPTISLLKIIYNQVPDTSWRTI